MKSTKRRYQWKPDVPDFRDFYFNKIPGKLSATRIPSSIDMRVMMSPVKDQGNLGSCTSQALASYLEYLENKTGISQLVLLSRLMIYFDERMVEGTINDDAGAFIRDGIKTLSQYGVCSEEMWPYDETKFKIKPPQPCYDDGMKRKIVTYARVNQDLNEIKLCMSQGNPIVFGMSVYDYFESDEMTKIGILRMPLSTESNLGGHCVLASGYDDSKKTILVKNSWGDDWGEKGYFEMPYDYILNDDLCEDLWMISK